MALKWWDPITSKHVPRINVSVNTMKIMTTRCILSFRQIFSSWDSLINRWSTWDALSVCISEKIHFTTIWRMFASRKILQNLIRWRELQSMNGERLCLCCRSCGVTLILLYHLIRDTGVSRSWASIVILRERSANANVLCSCQNLILTNKKVKRPPISISKATSASYHCRSSHSVVEFGVASGCTVNITVNIYSDNIRK